MRRSPTPSGKAGGRGFWNEARVAELGRLWAEGLTGSAIAERLGTTKDSVVSKAHRLQLEARVPDGPVPAGPSRLERRVAALAAATGTTAEALLGLLRRHRPVPRGSTVFATCQFILGDTGAAGRTGGRACGGKVARNAAGWPYCAEHLARCREPRRPEVPGAPTQASRAA